MDAGKVQTYLAHIAAYEREFAKWEKRVEKIVKRYRDEDSKNNKTRFNVLWSNVQTLKAATFARMPQPDVSRRFRDNDPVGRVASLLIERALEYELGHYNDYGATLRQATYDRFLGGRGTAWVRYEPTFAQLPTPYGEAQVSEDIEAESEQAQVLDFEAAPVDYVHWRDFGHSVARTWEEVTVIWRRVYMTRNMLRDRFPDMADKIPLDASPMDKDTRATDPDGVGKRAMIYEIWDKESGNAVWLSKSLGKIIDERPDPLGLQEFFPCPPPLYATLTTDSLVPIPDYIMYQDQANELDLLADRIDGLVQMLQLKGVYNNAIPELARLFTEGDNGKLIPVNNWMAFAEKQGLKGSIDLVEILPIAQALAEAYKAFEQVKQQIYEITGIADILRGQTAASETATAQQIKNSYASLRLKVYQDEVERFAARLLKLKAEIICNHFDDRTILQMASADQLSDFDKQLLPQALAMIRNNVMRQFRVEVASDSLIYQDEQQEKADRMEFLSATSQFVEKLVQAGQMAPQIIPLGVEMLKFGVTGFRVGKTLEGVIDESADQLKAMVAQQQQTPRPDPEMAKVQAQQQAAQMQAQQQQQVEAARMQQEQQLKQWEMQQEAQIEQQRIQWEAQKDQQAREHEAMLAVQKAQQEAQLKQMELDMEERVALAKAKLDADTRIAVAQIAAGNDPDNVDREDTANELADMIKMIQGQLDALTQHVTTPKPLTIERDETGRAVSVNGRPIVRDQNGAMVGVH